MTDEKKGIEERERKRVQAIVDRTNKQMQTFRANNNNINININKEKNGSVTTVSKSPVANGVVKKEQVNRKLLAVDTTQGQRILEFKSNGEVQSEEPSFIYPTTSDGIALAIDQTLANDLITEFDIYATKDANAMDTSPLSSLSEGKDVDEIQPIEGHFSREQMAAYARVKIWTKKESELMSNYIVTSGRTIQVRVNVAAKPDASISRDWRRPKFLQPRDLAEGVTLAMNDLRGFPRLPSEKDMKAATLTKDMQEALKQVDRYDMSDMGVVSRLATLKLFWASHIFKWIPLCFPLARVSRVAHVLSDPIIHDPLLKSLYRKESGNGNGGTRTATTTTPRERAVQFRVVLVVPEDSKGEIQPDVRLTKITTETAGVEVGVGGDMPQFAGGSFDPYQVNTVLLEVNTILDAPSLIALARKMYDKYSNIPVRKEGDYVMDVAKRTRYLITLLEKLGLGDDSNPARRDLTFHEIEASAAEITNEEVPHRQIFNCIFAWNDWWFSDGNKNKKFPQHQRVLVPVNDSNSFKDFNVLYWTSKSNQRGEAFHLALQQRIWKNALEMAKYTNISLIPPLCLTRYHILRLELDSLSPFTLQSRLISLLPVQDVLKFVTYPLAYISLGLALDNIMKLIKEQAEKIISKPALATIRISSNRNSIQVSEEAKWLKQESEYSSALEKLNEISSSVKPKVVVSTRDKSPLVKRKLSSGETQNKDKKAGRFAAGEKAPLQSLETKVPSQQQSPMQLSEIKVSSTVPRSLDPYRQIRLASVLAEWSASEFQRARTFITAEAKPLPLAVGYRQQQQSILQPLQQQQQTRLSLSQDASMEIYSFDLDHIPDQ